MPRIVREDFAEEVELFLALKAEHFVAELCRQRDQHGQRPYYGNGENRNIAIGFLKESHF